MSLASLLVRPRRLRASCGVFAFGLLTACAGDGGGGGTTPDPPAPVPVLGAVTPDTVRRGAADAVVTVTGSQFTRQSVVRLAGADRATEFAGPGQLRARLGAADLASAGVAEVTVFTPAPGGGTSAAGELVVANPVPSFTSLSVDTLLVGSAGATVTLLGGGFVPETTVWSAQRQYAVTYVSATELRVALTPADLQESTSIVLYVSNPEPGGGSASSSTITVVNPVPAVTAMTPDAVDAGTAPTLTLTGTGFVRGAVVRVGDRTQVPMRMSPTQMQITLTSAETATPGTLEVSVQTPPPGGGRSNVVPLVVRAPAPVVTSLLQSSTSAGQGSFVVYVNGSGFAPGSVVRFNGSPRPTIVPSSTQVQGMLSAADLQTPGTYAISVHTPGPGGGVSGTLPFTVVNGAPEVTSLAPAYVATGVAGATISVRGTGFVPQAQVLVNGAPRQTTYVSAGEVRVALTAADLAPAGYLYLGVRNPAPGGGVSGTLTLEVRAPVPVVTSISPAAVGDLAPGLTLRVAGRGFAANSVVRVDLSPRPTRMVSTTELEATLPASDLVWAGTVPIQVETQGPGGGQSETVELEVRSPAPVLASLASTQTVAGQTSYFLRMTGTGFRATSRVRLNGEERLTAFLGTTTLEVIVTEDDLRAPGVFAVTVATPGPGGGVSGALQFRVVAASPAARRP